MFLYTVIYTFIVTTNKNHLIIASQFTSLLLSERLSCRSHKNNTTSYTFIRITNKTHFITHLICGISFINITIILSNNRFYGFKNRRCHHEHTSPTTIWCIIYLTMLIMAKIPRIRYTHR